MNVGWIQFSLRSTPNYRGFLINLMIADYTLKIRTYIAQKKQAPQKRYNR